MSSNYQAYIDGRFVSARSGETFKSINPATEEPMGEVPLCGEFEVDAAVVAARQAFEHRGWRRTRVNDRTVYLQAIAQGIRRHANELAMLETQDSGKPIHDTQTGDIPEAAACFEHLAALASNLHGKTLEMPFGNFLDYSVREPLGVIGSIAAWNYPLVNAAWKIAPALAAGNCVVYKPAEDTSLSTLLLAQIIADAGLPPGVVNIVTGPGAQTGAALVRHPGIDKISFTGSTATGQTILHAAAEHVTKTILELGGKSPNIVFNDCDLDQAIQGSLFAIFVNAGQVCTAGSRLLIQDDIYDAFVDRFSHAIDTIRLGDPMDPQTRMGPLVSHRQLSNVMQHTQRAIAEGARLRIGGTRPTAFAKGYYFSPTVFEEVPLGSALDQQEVFGPVLAVYRFKDEAQAVQLANNTRYGLAAGIWTASLSRAHRVAQQLDCGTVWINTYNMVATGIPFSGFKQSGNGVELGYEGLKEYTRLKNVCVNLSPDSLNYFA